MSLYRGLALSNPDARRGGGPTFRLLVVTPRYLPDTGGVERHVYETARRIAAAGVDISVLTTDTTRSRLRYEVSEGIKIYRVPAWPKRRDYHLAPAIYGFVASGSWNFIHVQSWHTPVAPLAMLAAARKSIPYVVTPHGRGHASRLRKPMRPIQRRLLRPLLCRAAQVIALARFERDLLVHDLNLPVDLVSTIPNGSDLLPQAAGPVPSTAPTIVSVGRLERFKGHHRILEALPQILAERPDARLFIAGSGPYESALRQQARELGVAERVTIEFFPMSERERLASLIAGAALVVLLSEYETHPIAALEAAALGKPVLVADVAGLRELAEEGLAWPFPLEGTTSELARAVLAQFDEPFVPRSIELPTWDDCTCALLRVYETYARV